MISPVTEIRIYAFLESCPDELVLLPFMDWRLVDSGKSAGRIKKGSFLSYNQACCCSDRKKIGQTSSLKEEFRFVPSARHFLSQTWTMTGCPICCRPRAVPNGKIPGM